MKEVVSCVIGAIALAAGTFLYVFGRREKDRMTIYFGAFLVGAGVLISLQGLAAILVQ